ncbi:hypothetical protein CB0940_02290 [Cercospora beticola]|uniref:Uncharacterized protein n=1 Tax=Cercospora beticola TaxID=122368 RepID=A0A2G5I414_CERBT|nr:hypothetical protein CB0940_02290 [Cercospora beticola]PIA99539.1 hypothetical protein CB0940_02290 [Cercospora beticola]WPA99410.1 hypothetical protein RHO25_004027 [Cercospora beticola]
MSLGRLFGGLVLGLLSFGAVASTTASQGLIAENTIANGTATAPAVLESSARMISVTNTTLITKFVSSVDMPNDLEAPQIKAYRTTCITTLNTIRCHDADRNDATPFTPTRVTFTDIYETGHSFVTSVYTTQAVATMAIPKSKPPAIMGDPKYGINATVTLSTDTRDRIFEKMQSACFEGGHHLRKRQHPQNGLYCDISRELEAGLYDKLGGEITAQLGDVLIPPEWAAYFLSAMIDQHTINRAYQLATAFAIMRAGYQIGDALNWEVSVPLYSFQNMIRALTGGASGTATSATKTTTSDRCAMCTNPTVCHINPNDDQGTNGDKEDAVWPFPRASGLVTTALNFLCRQGVEQANSQTWCNCGKTRYITHKYVYTSDVKGSKTVLTDNCPYTTTPAPKRMLYTPPSNPPVSDPRIVTAPITNTFKCSSQTTAAGDFHTSWCACPDGKNYVMTKNVYGISTKGSTSWTTSTCGYTKAPAIGGDVMTAPPPPPTPTGPPPKGWCSTGEAIHWERAAASSVVTKFCSQMSASYKTYAGSKDINTLEGNHKSWDGSKSERSYPMKTSVPEAIPNPKDPNAMKIRITHDQKSCNATQKDTGCHFDFRAGVKRCEYFLQAAMGSCKTYKVYMNPGSIFGGWENYLGKEWVPEAGVKGDGIKWEILPGKKCKEPPADGKKPKGGDKALRCWQADWMEQVDD